MAASLQLDNVTSLVELIEIDGERLSIETPGVSRIRSRTGWGDPLGAD